MFVVIIAITNCTYISHSRTPPLAHFSAPPTLQLQLSSPSHYDTATEADTDNVTETLKTGLIAAVFLIMSIATVIYPYHEIFAEMFVVPVGALFAFTSVRANLPGAPDGFGASIGTSLL